MKLAINMFAGAVASFANAIDENQAIAAWAGEVGRASGIGQRGNDSTNPTENKAIEHETIGGKKIGKINDHEFVSGRAGESKQNIIQQQTAQTIAGRLGVSVNQLRRGDVGRGDVSFAAHQIESGISNNLFNLNRELMIRGKPAMEYARIKTEIRNQTTGLENMKKYSGKLVEDSKPGKREITEGERPIMNVNSIIMHGIKNPEEFTRSLYGEYNEAQNSFHDGVSH